MNDQGRAGSPIRGARRWLLGLIALLVMGCARPVVPTGVPTAETIASATLSPTLAFPPATPVATAESVAVVTQGLAVSPLVLDAVALPLYDPLEITFAVNGTAATNLDFPYDPDPPPGLPGRIGITVEGLFLPPGETNWSRAQIQPSFRFQDYRRVTDLTAAEVLVPTGEPSWRVRFSPTTIGAWQVKVRAQDASLCAEGPPACEHWVESEAAAFDVSEPRPGRHGFIQVSAADPRYFEYSDGTFFRVAGFQDGLGTDTDVDAAFATYAANGVTLLRGWMSASSIFSRGISQWAAWANSELDWQVRAPEHDVSARLAAGTPTACMFQGFGESVRPAFFAGRTYHLAVRARIDGVTGPRDPGRPFGLVVRLGGWPKDLCAEADPGARYLSSYWTGDGTWADYTASFELDADVVLNGGAYLTVALENAAAGSAYIDSVVIRDGEHGANILPHGNLNDHLGFDQAASWRWDQILESADAHRLALKLVVLEKQDGILGYIQPDGSIAAERDDANFYGISGQDTKVRRLQEYYWRYLTARWGYSTAVHSWELINEGDPFNGNHYELANGFARTIDAIDPNRHLVTTSFWHSFPVDEFWANREYPDIDYADFHAYVDTTWLTPEDFAEPALSAGCGLDLDCFKRAMTADSALYHLTHSAAVEAAALSMPVIRGEGALTVTGSQQVSDPDLMRDTAGVWLHKLLFAQLAPGAVQELYWYPDEIQANDLYGLFGRYRDFLAGVDLNAGGWQAAQAEVDADGLRVVGQVNAGRDQAALWLDNAGHTWRAVVDGQAISPISAEIRLEGFRPGAALRVTWQDLCSGAAPTCRIAVDRVEVQTADADGSVILAVRDLMTDVGVRIEPVP